MDLRYQPANPTPQAQVQNHIKGVHACAMALLAESATGAVFGMNVPDSAIPCGPAPCRSGIGCGFSCFVVFRMNVPDLVTRCSA